MATSKIFLVMAGLVVSSGAVVACSSDDAASSPTGDGDGNSTPDTGNDDHDGDAGNSQTQTDSGACSGPAASQIGLFGTMAMRLQQTADALFVWDIRAGDTSASTGNTGAIMRMPKTGGDPTVLYKPSVNTHAVLDVLAEGADVYTAEFDNDGNSSTAGVLLRIPAAGGAATTVATLTKSSNDFGNLVAVDDKSVFFTQNDSLYRVARAGGVPVEIAALGVETISAQIFGDDLILSQKLAGSSVWRVPRTAASKAEAQKLTDRNNCMGDLLAVTGGYYCASTLSITKLDSNFVVGDKVYSLLDSGDPGAVPRFAGVDGNHVLFGAKASASAPGPFRSFDVGETSTKIIACGIGSWLEAAVDANAVYLLQQQAGTDAPTQVVRFMR